MTDIPTTSDRLFLGRHKVYEISLNETQTYEYIYWVINDLIHDNFGNISSQEKRYNMATLYKYWLVNINHDSVDAINAIIDKILNLPMSAYVNRLDSIDMLTPTNVVSSPKHNMLTIIDNFENKTQSHNVVNPVATSSVFYDKQSHTATCAPQLGLLFNFSECDIKPRTVPLCKKSSYYNLLVTSINSANRDLSAILIRESFVCKREVRVINYNYGKVACMITGVTSNGNKIVLAQRNCYIINGPQRSLIQLFGMLEPSSNLSIGQRSSIGQSNAIRPKLFTTISEFTRDQSASVAASLVKYFLDRNTGRIPRDDQEKSIIFNALSIMFSKQWGDLGLVFDSVVLGNTCVITTDGSLINLCILWGIPYKIHTGEIMRNTQQNIEVKIYGQNVIKS
jgi:hypothetical protein